MPLEMRVYAFRKRMTTSASNRYVSGPLLPRASGGWHGILTTAVHIIGELLCTTFVKTVAMFTALVLIQRSFTTKALATVLQKATRIDVVSVQERSQ